MTMQMGEWVRFPDGDIANYHVILDNVERKRLNDGCYARSYWTQRDGDETFHVVTYKRAPDLLRLEFDWAEVR